MKTDETKKTKGKAPGKWFRAGMSLQEFFRQFPDDATAEKWFEQQRWDGHIACPHCGAMDDRIAHCKNRNPQPYRCRDCRKHFSVKSSGIMHNSQLGCQTWLLALYLICTNLKGVSSMRLHRELDITQKAAWHLAHRIRKAMEAGGAFTFDGPVEVDEVYIGGKRKNMHQWQRDKLSGRGASGKIAVAGILDRATNQVAVQMVHSTNRATLHQFIENNVKDGAMVYTDEASAYLGLTKHQHKAVKHSMGEFVKGLASTNSIESHWSMFKRGYHGTYHKMSMKHLPRYISEFSRRHNDRVLDTMAQMERVAANMGTRRLPRKQLMGGPPAWQGSEKKAA